MANILSKDLKASVLQAAIQGKLTEQLSTDGNARDLLAKIKTEKEQLIKDKKIKKEKALTPISDDEKPFDIPENWEWVKLGDIANIIRGLTFDKSLAQKERFNNSTLVCRGGNIDSDTETINFIDNIYLPTNIIKDEQFLKKHDCLIVASSGTKTSVGKSCLILEDYSNISFGGFMMVVRSHTLINPVLISYHIKRYRQQIIAMTNGYISNITVPILTNLLIPLPPLAEQKRIVERVDALMKEIEELEKIEIELENLKKQFPIDLKASLLQAAMQGKLTEQLSTDSNVDDLIEQIKEERKKLEDEGKIKKTSSKSGLTNSLDEEEYPFEIPNSWRWISAKEIGDIVVGATPKTENPKYWGGNISWLASGCCQDCEVLENNKNLKKITQDGYDSCSTKMMPENTILIALTGSTAGKIGILKFKACGNQSIVGITTNNLMLHKFLFYQLMCRRFEILSDCVGSAQPHISKDYITKMFFAVPPIEEQQRIVKQLDKLLPMCEN